MKKCKGCLLEKWSKVLAFYYSSNTLRLIAYDTTAKINNYDISDNCVMENRNIKILKENEEIPVEFRSLLLDLYESLTEFTEGLKFSNLELLGKRAIARTWTNKRSFFMISYLSF